jgi:hypothetical protein
MERIQEISFTMFYPFYHDRCCGKYKIRILLGAQMPYEAVIKAQKINHFFSQLQTTPETLQNHLKLYGYLIRQYLLLITKSHDQLIKSIEKAQQVHGITGALPMVDKPPINNCVWSAFFSP